jgi:quinol-cytochrome oxidoreductase complex cytochrome b subunit
MAANWTQALRKGLERNLPADQLLPDQQPRYVRSAVYLFGAFTIASVALVILSGVVLAIFGPQWWHTNGVGHFFNSLHFWSVQIFFIFLVLHLWSMFFMGAWRDGRGRTWVTGGIAFSVTLIAAFTGYVSQSNFDSQWIAVSAKDAMNAIGIGGFFNVLNFGQMYGLHIVILPAVVLGLVALHIVLVRVRGVVKPYAVPGEQRAPYRADMTQTEYYRNVPMAPYDLIREVTLVSMVTLIVVVVFAGIFSSPDAKPMTMQSVAQSDPVGFTTVSLSELANTSALASYGQPYNTGTDSVQAVGPLSPQKIAGVGIPIDTAQTYVLQPLATVKSLDVEHALATFQAAAADQQSTWTTNFATALGNNTTEALDANGNVQTGCTTTTGAPTDCGPLPVMFGTLLGIARSGALDGLLLSSNGQFYQTDYTKPLLFLNESALPGQAANLHLLGNQWGMMNETGAYPGQAWLWLYTFWYQVPLAPFNGPNADIAVWLVMAVLTLILIFVPYIPGLNRIPALVGIHRLIWREHYREAKATVAAQTATTLAAS